MCLRTVHEAETVLVSFSGSVFYEISLSLSVGEEYFCRLSSSLWPCKQNCITEVSNHALPHMILSG